MFRVLLLAGLVLQNASLIVVMRATRQRVAGAPTHAASTCVFLSELLKMSIVLLVLLAQNGANLASVLRREVFENRQTMLMSIPAFLYTFQTNILWVGKQCGLTLRFVRLCNVVALTSLCVCRHFKFASAHLYGMLYTFRVFPFFIVCMFVNICGKRSPLRNNVSTRSRVS